MNEVVSLRRRLRALAIGFALIFPLVWVIWMWPFDDAVDRSGTPAGGDFPVFYVAAQLLQTPHGRALYDFQAQSRQLHADLPQLRPEIALPYLYPPFVAAAARPLGNVSYVPALVLFLLFIGTCWAATILVVRRSLPIFRTIYGESATLWMLATPLLWENVLGGQLSALACAIVAVSFALLKTERVVLAGILFGAAAYKPNVLLFVGTGIVIARPRMIIGLLIAALLLYIAGSLGAGWDALPRYLAALRSPEAHEFIANPPFEKFHGLLRVFPWERAHISANLGVLIGMPLAGWIGYRWRGDRRPGADSIALGTLIVVQSLFNPYVPIYDLLQLSLGALLIADGLHQRFGDVSQEHSTAFYVLLAVVLLGPFLSEALAPRTGVQLFPLALFAAAGWLAWRVRAAERAPSA